jgi:hypothetical protein
VLTDLAEIQRQGESKKAENLDFRRYLAAHHFAAEQFQRLAGEIQKEVDCTACANCCRYSTVTVGQSETSAIARYLRMEPDEVIRQYTEPCPDERDTRALRSASNGCVFLDGNLCLIYEARPKACREFPHIRAGEHSPASRLSSLCRWAPICPIVYNALETLKRVTGYPAQSA